MGIFDFLTGEFIDVIHWVDDTRDTMVWRFEREGHEIKYGAKLTVREGQAAVFVHEGQLADVFTPGLYMLETNNMPILTTLQHWDHGFRSPFKSEIYFVNTTRFNDLKWGTKNPIICRDPEFGPVRIRAFGTYSVRVTDPARFLTEIVGTDGEFTMDEISFQIRNIIVQEFSRAIAASGIPVLDMAANTADLGKLVGARDRADARKLRADHARALHREHLAAARGRGGAGQAHLDGTGGRSGPLHPVFRRRGDDLGRREPRRAAAWPPGSAPAWAWRWARRWRGRAPGAPRRRRGAVPPPPPPVEHVWHIAEDGATAGPFSKAAMGRMASEGRLTRDSLVWTAGQDGWKRAEEVQELAQLFTVLPPPPPGA